MTITDKTLIANQPIVDNFFGCKITDKMQLVEDLEKIKGGLKYYCPKGLSDCLSPQCNCRK